MRLPFGGRGEGGYTLPTTVIMAVLVTVAVAAGVVIVSVARSGGEDVDEQRDLLEVAEVKQGAREVSEPVTANTAVTGAAELPRASISGGEAVEGHPVVFTVQLSQTNAETQQENAFMATETVWVYYATESGSAAGGQSGEGDFQQNEEGAVRIRPGNSSATIEVSTRDDGQLESYETFNVRLTGSGYNAVVHETEFRATGGIIDGGVPGDNAQGGEAPSASRPSVRIETDANTVTEGFDAIFSIVLTKPAETGVTVWYATERGTARESDDFQKFPRTSHRFNAGDTFYTLRVATVDDTVGEDNETFSVRLLGVSGGDAYVDPKKAVASMTILANDSGRGQPEKPKISLVGDGSAVADGRTTVAEGEPVSLRARLSYAISEEVTVRLSTAAGVNNPAQSNDYQAVNSQTVTIAANSHTSGPIIIPTTPDGLDESDETFLVTLTSPSSNAELGDPTTVTVTIDEDGAVVPLVTITGPAQPVIEGSTISFTVELSAPPPADQEIVVNYTTSYDTASAADFNTAANPTSGFVTFSGSDRETSQTITLSTLDDTSYELDETFAVILNSPSGNARLGDPLKAFATIQDNDPKPTITLSDGQAFEGRPVEFTATLSQAVPTSVEVRYQTSIDLNGVAPADHGDYILTTGWVVFAPNTTTETFTVNTIDDTIDEPDEETFFVTLSSATEHARLAGTVQATGKVLDDDGPKPIIAIEGDSKAKEGQPIVFTVKLLDPSDSTLLFPADQLNTPVTVLYSTTDNTAEAGTDYHQASKREVTILAGRNSQTFAINTQEDVLIETDETFTVTLLEPSPNAQLGEPDSITATGTIENDDEPPTLSVLDGQGMETAGDAGKVEFTAILSRAITEEVKFRYTLADGTAKVGDDYIFTSETVVIPPNTTSHTFTIGIKDDTDYEPAPHETFTLTLRENNLERAELHDDPARITATGTIIDNDNPPTVSIADGRGSENGASGRVEFTVELSHASNAPVTVAYSTSPGTASTADYTDPQSPVSFSAGVKTATITINVIDDTIYEPEPDETFTVTLHSPTNARLGRTADITATGAIDDNDSPPEVTFTPASRSRSAQEGATMTFTVNLSHAVSKTVEVPFFSTNGTASTADYDLPASTTLSFAAGETSKDIVVTAENDNIYEPGDNETFTITLRSPTNARLGGIDPITQKSTISATGEIIDTDTKPTISISSATVDEDDPETGNNGTENFTVRLIDSSNMPARASKPVTMYIVTADGTAKANEDYTAYSRQQITIPAATLSTNVELVTLHDNINEPDETFTITLSSPSDNAQLSSDPTVTEISATITIRDNDDPPEISISGDPDSDDNSISASEGSPIEFTVSLNRPASDSITVTYTATNTSSRTNAALTSNNDFDTTTHPLTGTITFARGETSKPVTIATSQDQLNEPNEEFTVTLSAITGRATLHTTNYRATGIITNDDAIDIIIDTPAAVTEGNPINFTVRLSRPSSQTITVRPITRNGTAKTSDYDLPATATLEFTPGQQQKTYTVTTTDDNIDEPDEETFTVTLTNATGGAQIGAIDPITGTRTGFRATGTIQDNDDAPTITINSPAAVAEGGSINFTVRLSRPSSQEITVRPITRNGTAKTSDYNAPNSETLKFTSGQRERTYTVEAENDDIYEPAPHETFTVTLTNATGGAQLGEIDPITGTRTGIIGTGTIRDTDTEPTVTFAATSRDLSVIERQAFTFTLQLSHAASQDVTVAYRIDHRHPSNTIDEVTGDPSHPPTNASDFSRDATSGTATISKGATTGTFTIQTDNDNADEPPREHFTVILSSPLTNARLASTAAGRRAFGAIRDNDGTPIISIDAAKATEGSPIRFTIQLSKPSSQPVTVNYAATHTGLQDTADANDFDTATYPLSGTVTFAADETSKPVTIGTKTDESSESDEKFTIELSGITGTARLHTTKYRAQGTIEDDDNAIITLAGGEASEASALGVRFAITLSNPLSRPGSVRYDVTHGGHPDNVVDTDTGKPSHPPTDASDFMSGATPTSVSVTIPANTLSVVFYVKPVNDTDDEPDKEYFTVTLHTASGAQLDSANPAKSKAIGAILDNDSPKPVISFENSATPKTGNEGQNIAFKILLSDPASQSVDVTYTTSFGPALDNTNARSADLQGTITDTVTIPAGDTEWPFNIRAANDNIDEPNETFTVTLSLADGMERLVTLHGTNSQTTGRIIDTDIPAIYFDNTHISVSEGSSAVYTVLLSQRSTQSIQVTYQVTHGSSANPTAPRTSSDDFDTTTNPLGGTLTFAAGQNRKTAPIDIKRDTNHTEPSETFTITLSGATAGAQLGDIDPITGQATGITATGTIHERPVISLDGHLVEGLNHMPGLDNGTLRITRLRGSLDETIQLRYRAYSSTSGTGIATSDVDYTAKSGTITLAAGDYSETIPIETLDDTQEEPTEIFMLELTKISSNFSLGGGSAASISRSIDIYDDDTPVEVNFTNDYGDGVHNPNNELIEGRPVHFTACLSRPTRQTVTAYYDFNNPDDTATPVIDYQTPALKTISFPPRSDRCQALRVETVNDNIHEPRSKDDNDEEPDRYETFTVTLTSTSTNAVPGTTRRTSKGEIVDDDPIPIINRVVPASATEGNPVNFTVKLSNPSTQQLAVKYLVTLNTAMAADLDPATPIAPTSGTLYLTTISDPDPDPSRGDPSDGAIATFPIATIDDTLDEGNETFTVTLTPLTSNDIANLPGGKLPDGTAALSSITNGAATGTILNNAKPTLDIWHGQAEEGCTVTLCPSADNPNERIKIPFKVYLKNPPAQRVTVDYATGHADDTAQAGSDYIHKTGTLTFEAGQTEPETIEVTIEGDTTSEPDEKFTVTLTNPTNGVLLGEAAGAELKATGTIVNDDGTPQISVINGEAYEDSDITFTVKLTGNNNQPLTFSQDISVRYKVRYGTSASADDLTGDLGNSVTILAGKSEKTFTISTKHDDISEGTGETFFVDLTEPSRAQLKNPYLRSGVETITAIGTIRERFRLESVTQHRTLAGGVTQIGTSAEGETHKVRLRLNRSHTLPISLKYKIKTQAGQATTADFSKPDGTDFRPTGEIFTIPANSLTADIPIYFKTDGDPDPDETFTISFFEPSPELNLGSYLSDPEDTSVDIEIRILDIDGAPAVSIRPTSKDSDTVNEDQNIRFTVHMTKIYKEDVEVFYTISYNTSNPTDKTAEDDDFASSPDSPFSRRGSVTITQGMTSASLIIPTLADNLDEPLEEKFTVTLDEPEGDPELSPNLSETRVVGTIRDNDTSRVFIESDESAGEDGELAFTIRLEPPSTQEVRVTATATNGTGSATDDPTGDSDFDTTTYALSKDDITFNRYQTTSETFTIEPAEDDIYDPDEKFTVTLSGATGGAQLGRIDPVTGSTIGITAVGTITDTTGLPTATLSGGNSAYETGEITFTATLSHASSKRVELPYTLSHTSSDPDAQVTKSTDFPASALTGTRTFIPGQPLTQNFNVRTVANENNDSFQEKFTLSLDQNSRLTNAQRGSPYSAEGTIKERAQLKGWDEKLYLVEGHNSRQVKLELQEGYPERVTIPYTISYGATSPNDFLTGAPSGSITFNANQPTSNIPITVRNDSSEERPETFTITLGNLPDQLDPAGVGTSKTITIYDDDAPLYITLASDGQPAHEAPEHEATDKVEFTATLKNSYGDTVAAGRAATVRYGTSHGTANPSDEETEADDFNITTHPLSANLTFAPDDISKPFYIQAADDDIHDPNEKFTVTLTNPTNASLGTPHSAVGAIKDDDEALTITLTSSPVNEGGTITFRATLSRHFSEPITVTYNIADGDYRDTTKAAATVGSDFTRPSSHTFTFQTDQADSTSLTKTFTIATTDDNLDEPDQEYFTVILPQTDYTAEAKGVGIINDTDTANLTIASKSGYEGQPITFTAQLTDPSGNDQPVTYSEDLTASYTIRLNTAEAADFRDSTSGDITFPAGATAVEFPAINTFSDAIDDSIEGDETFTFQLTLKRKTTPPTVKATAEATGTIKARAQLKSWSLPSDTELLEGDTLRVTLNLKAAHGNTGENATVNYRIVDGHYSDNTKASTGDSDFPPTSPPTSFSRRGSVSFTATQTVGYIDIPTQTDDLEDGDKTFHIVLSGSETLTLALDPGLDHRIPVTILDADATVTITLEGGEALEDEEELIFTATLNRTPREDVTVYYTTSHEYPGNTATEADYQAPSKTKLTFRDEDGEITKIKEIKIRIHDRQGAVPSRLDPRVTFTVVLSDPSDNAELDPAQLDPNDSTKSIATGTIREYAYLQGWTATPALSSNGTVEIEEGNSLTFNISLQKSYDKKVRLKYKTTLIGDTEAADFGHVGAAQWVEIPRGELTPLNPITISTTDDDIFEDPEQFKLEITEVSVADENYAALKKHPTSYRDPVITILDDDERPPSITLTGGQATEGTDINFTAHLSYKLPTESVTVTYRIDYASATANDLDPNEPRNGTFTIPANRSSHTFDISTRDDGPGEDTETFTITLTGITTNNAEIGSAYLSESISHIATGTIYDKSSTAPTVTIADPANSSREGPGVSITFNLAMTPANPGPNPIIVSYRLISGTAIKNLDFEAGASNPSVTFGANQSTAQIRVSLKQDSYRETDETFRVELLPTSDIRLGHQHIATGTITDDGDAYDPPKVTLTDGEGEEGGHVTFTVKLSKPATRPVEIFYSVDIRQGSDTAEEEDFTRPSDRKVIFNAGESSKPLNIPANRDGVSDSPETFTVRITRVSDTRYAQIDLPRSATGTINEASDS